MPCRLFYNGFFAASRHAVRQYRIRDVQDFCAKPVYVISHSRPVAPLAKIFFIIQEALAIVIDIYQFPGLYGKYFRETPSPWGFSSYAPKKRMSENR